MLTVTPTYSALLAGVRAAPDDDAPRLVLADYLDEQGEAEWAELVRLQVRLSRLDKWPCGKPMADPSDRALEHHLLGRAGWLAAGPDWLVQRSGDDGETSYNPVVRYARGFVETAWCRADQWLAHGDDILSRHPVRSVHLRNRPLVRAFFWEDPPAPAPGEPRGKTVFLAGAVVRWGNKPAVRLMDRQYVNNRELRDYQDIAWLATEAVYRRLLQAANGPDPLRHWWPGVEFNLPAYDYYAVAGARRVVACPSAVAALIEQPEFAGTTEVHPSPSENARVIDHSLPVTDHFTVYHPESDPVTSAFQVCRTNLKTYRVRASGAEWLVRAGLCPHGTLWHTAPARYTVG